MQPTPPTIVPSPPSEATPAPGGFEIEPATPAEDSAKHDIAPPDPDQTLPPSR
jgi:hypothetical protein